MLGLQKKENQEAQKYPAHPRWAGLNPEKDPALWLARVWLPLGCWLYIANQRAAEGSVSAVASAPVSLCGRSRRSAIVQLSLNVMEDS